MASQWSELMSVILLDVAILVDSQEKEDVANVASDAFVSVLVELLNLQLIAIFMVHFDVSTNTCYIFKRIVAVRATERLLLTIS
jgi:hypothetical protein